jgi:alpha-L-fucosidase
MQISTSKDIIHKLIEVVSNNGHLLLNMSPMYDGTFPQDQKDVMANVGVWLWSYGESIYGTRPFVISSEKLNDKYKVHYTRKDNCIYIIFLDWPGTENPLFLSACNSKNINSNIRSATLLSVKRNYICSFSQSDSGLILSIPKGARLPSDAAQVIRLTLE